MWNLSSMRFWIKPETCSATKQPYKEQLLEDISHNLVLFVPEKLL